MTLYYFHVEDGTFLEDTEGTQLPSMQEAGLYAVDASSEILRSGGRNALRTGRPWRMRVTDVNFRLFLTVEFSATSPAFPVTYKPGLAA